MAENVIKTCHVTLIIKNVWLRGDNDLQHSSILVADICVPSVVACLHLVAFYLAETCICHCACRGSRVIAGIHLAQLLTALCQLTSYINE